MRGSPTEPCPFCGKPIVREYGSFRCKHCARSSEDMLDMERKARAAELRRVARSTPKAAPVPAAGKSPNGSKASSAAPGAPESRPTKSARLRMVAHAHARIAGRKRAVVGDGGAGAAPVAPKASASRGRRKSD